MDAMNRFSLRVVRGSAWPDDVTGPMARHGDPSAECGSAEANERQLIVVVDGVAELSRWGGMGLDPDDVLNPALPWLPPADGTAMARVVQRCGCGIIGCGSLTMTIRRSGSTVVWSNAREGERRYEIGPFRFDAEAYEAEIRRADRERPWERPDETVARLVAEALRDLLGAHPRSFDWASANFSPGEVVVSVTDHRPNPRAGEPLGPGYPDGKGGLMQGIEPTELFDQHLGVFPIQPGTSAEQAAEAIITAVRTQDPATWTPPDLRH